MTFSSISKPQHCDYRRTVSIALVILLALEPVLWGCSTEDPQPPDPNPVETATISGSVNESTIGGEDLVVVSAWDEAQSVDANGDVNITVSSEGAQLLVVQDVSFQMRALAISIPGSGRGKFDNLLFDASSTLMGLLAMTPGLLTLDPANARQRQDELRALSEYSSALSLFEQQLPNHTVAELLQMMEVNNALDACIRAWATRHRDKIDRTKLPDRNSGFTALVLDDSSPANTQVQLANEAWRFLNIHRRDMNAQGQELGVETIANGIHSMNGAEPIGWGSVFTWTVGDPTRGVDVVDFSSVSEIVQSQYWAVGMGWGDGSMALPASIDGGYGDAIAMSITWYLAFPLIDFLLGSAHLLELGGEGLALAWSVISGLNTTNISGASNNAEIIAATIDIAFSCISLLAIAGATGGLLGISTPAWIVVGAILAAFGAGFALANAILAVDSWVEIPHVAMEAVQVDADGDVLIYDDCESYQVGYPPPIGDGGVSEIWLRDDVSVTIDRDSDGIQSSHYSLIINSNEGNPWAGVGWHIPLIDVGVLRFEGTCSLRNYYRATVMLTFEGPMRTPVFSDIQLGSDGVISAGGHPSNGGTVVGHYIPQAPFGIRIEIIAGSTEYSVTVDEGNDGFENDEVIRGIGRTNGWLPYSGIEGAGIVFNPVGEQVDVPAVIAWDDVTIIWSR